MKLSILNIILISISVLLILVIIIQWIIWKYRKTPFTRERFAFISLTLLSTIIIYFIPFLFGSNLVLEVANLISTYFFDSPIGIEKPDFSDKILAFLFVVFFGYLSTKFFNNWNGKKSLHHFELEKLREKTNIISEALVYLEKNEKLREFKPKIDDHRVFDLKEPEIETIAWHEQVFDLFTLSSYQYKIDRSNDWFQKESCYISTFGKQKQPLAIFCSIKLPAHKKIYDFVKFVKKQIPKDSAINNVKFIIAVKNEEKLKKSIEVDDCTVDILSEDILLDELVDFSNYYEHLRYNFEEKEIINGYNFTLNDVYTKPNCEVRNRDERKITGIIDIEKYIVDWLNDANDKKHLTILGEYGQGKSVLSQRISYSLIKNQNLANRVPIIIELRGRYPKQYSNSLALLAEWCTAFSINPKALLKLHYAGKLLIIFEGFDEMELVGDYDIRVEHFRKLWGFSTPNSKIIITGRPNFFLNDNELRALLRTSTEYRDLTYCEEIYLKRFTKLQIENTLRNVNEGIKEDIMSILKEQSGYSSFFDLMSRPSSLFLTSIVWNERNLSQYKNNINSALVIEEFLKHSYSRQENKGQKSALSIYERAYFMKGIAVAMVNKNRYTNQISQVKLRDVVVKLYNGFPEEITKQEINRSGYNKKLQKRFDNRYSIETILLDIRSCGVLVRDLATFDSFKFAHKSFLELLASNYITYSLFEFESNNNNLEKIINNSISKALSCSPDDISKSPDVIKFIAEQTVRLIQIKDDLSEKEKIREIFKLIYPIKWIRMETIFKLVLVFGHNVRKGLIQSLFVLFLSGIAGYYLSIWTAKLLSRLHSNELLQIISFPILFIFTTILLFHLIFNKILKQKDFREIQLHYLSQELIDHPEIRIHYKYFLPYSGVVNDEGNLLLMYLICQELNLLEALEKLMKKKLFSILCEQEESINKMKNFYFEKKESLNS